jgi:cobalamin biosynthesis Mg chelatase CobN
MWNKYFTTRQQLYHRKKMTLEQLRQEITEYYEYYKECCEDAETTPIPQDEYIEQITACLYHCIDSQVQFIAYNQE